MKWKLENKIDLLKERILKEYVERSEVYFEKSRLFGSRDLIIDISINQILYQGAMLGKESYLGTIYLYNRIELLVCSNIILDSDDKFSFYEIKNACPMPSNPYI